MKWLRRTPEPPAQAVVPAMTDGDLYHPKALGYFGSGLEGIPSSTDETIQTLIDALADSGTHVRLPWSIYFSVDQALCVAAVYRCTALISGNVMQCPIQVFAESREGDHVVMRPALPELQRMLNRQPHPLFSGPQMVEYATACMLLYGDGYCMVDRDGMGDVVGLKPFHPNRVEVISYAGGDRLVYRMRDRMDALGGDTRYYNRDMSEVIDWQGAMHDGIGAQSVIRKAAASAIGLHQDVEFSSHEFLNTGNMQKILLRRNTGAKPGEQEVKDLERRWREAYGGGISTRSKPVILDNGWDEPYELSINPADAQLLGTRKIAVKDILRAFGAPNVLAGDEEGVSAWGSGVAEISKNFLKHTVGQILRRFETELTRKLCPIDSPYVIRFDTSQLLRGSPSERATYMRTALGSGSSPGWMTVNEVRASEGLPPLKGEEYDTIKVSGGSSPGEALDEALDKKADDDDNAPDEVPDAPPMKDDE